jgi:hypothetical protein
VNAQCRHIRRHTAGTVILRFSMLCAQTGSEPTAIRPNIAISKTPSKKTTLTAHANEIVAFSLLILWLSWAIFFKRTDKGGRWFKSNRPDHDKNHQRTRTSWIVWGVPF